MTETGGFVIEMVGIATLTGGFATKTGGSVTKTVGFVTDTGGFIIETGGLVTETGGIVNERVGSVTERGGSVTQTGGCVAETVGEDRRPLGVNTGHPTAILEPDHWPAGPCAGATRLASLTMRLRELPGWLPLPRIVALNRSSLGQTRVRP